MKDVRYYSNLKEDQFIFELLVKRRGEMGYFLDLGCGNGVDGNNTIALEKIGWTGILMDKDPAEMAACRQNRQATTITADPTTYDWSNLPRKSYDYISLKLGVSTLATLTVLLAAGLGFKAATIPYNGSRPAIRDLLQQNGYTLMLGDVGNPPSEDWWVTPNIKSIMFDLSPYVTKQTTILPAIPCIPCGAKKK